MSAKITLSKPVEIEGGGYTVYLNYKNMVVGAAQGKTIKEAKDNAHKKMPLAVKYIKDKNL
jgi:hypothetical protein